MHKRVTKPSICLHFYLHDSHTQCLNSSDERYIDVLDHKLTWCRLSGVSREVVLLRLKNENL